MTKILVVDDEIETLNLLKTILEISGFEVITTLNSVDAIKLAEIEKPDVVLPDIMMPEMDGFTLCKLMREHSLTKDLPIIFVTAYTGNDLDDRSEAVGADHVIKKPINIPELVAAIRKSQALREKGSVGTTKPQSEAKKPNNTEQKGSVAPQRESIKATSAEGSAEPKTTEKKSNSESKPAMKVSSNNLSSTDKAPT